MKKTKLQEILDEKWTADGETVVMHIAGGKRVIIVEDDARAKVVELGKRALALVVQMGDDDAKDAALGGLLELRAVRAATRAIR